MAECMPLVVGIPGPTLAAKELAVLQHIQPCGIILFERNIDSVEQVRELIADLVEIEPRPFLAIDLEGGAVNRLRPIWGELPSPAEAAAAGRRAVRALGAAAGAACRRLGIHLDLAPVVDLARPNGVLTQQGRCLSGDSERTATLARVFYEGLTEWGVAGCIKHFPGLGEVSIDTHDELPTLALTRDQLEEHEHVFASLSAEISAVMVGHVVVPALGDPDIPASLSPAVVQRAAALPGSPVILSDDLEMGALADSGELPDRVAGALTARNHGVLVCKAFAQLPAIAARLTEETAEDSSAAGRILEMAARMDAFRCSLLRNAAAIPAPDDTTVEQLWQRARKAATPPASE